MTFRFTFRFEELKMFGVHDNKMRGQHEALECIELSRSNSISHMHY